VLLRRRGRARRERGAVAVEFAVIFGFILVPLTMGMIDYGWYFYSSQVTGSATRETARRLSVGDCTTTTPTTTKAQDFARSQAGMQTLNLQYGSTSTLNNALPPVGDTLRVQSTNDGKLIGLIPLPGVGAITKTVETRVEDNVEDSPC
jgi:Flp pilus assembly protein TadG